MMALSVSHFRDYERWLPKQTSDALRHYGEEGVPVLVIEGEAFDLVPSLNDGDLADLLYQLDRDVQRAQARDGRAGTRPILGKPGPGLELTSGNRRARDHRPRQDTLAVDIAIIAAPARAPIMGGATTTSMRWACRSSSARHDSRRHHQRHQHQQHNFSRMDRYAGGSQ